MADFSGIGAFAEGATRGYDAGLSRYATIEDMRRRRESEQRAAQAQALQSLISGSKLALEHPDVAERFVQQPGQEILPVEPVMAGVQRARTMQSAAQKFARAVQSGEFDENDPEIGQFVAQDPVKYAPLLNEAMGKKRLKTILADPNMTPQQRAQAIISSGIKVDLPMLQAGYPGLVGGVEQAKTAAGLRGQMEEGPGGKPLVGEVEGARVGAAKRAESDIELEAAPGRKGVSRVQAGETERFMGRTSGEQMARMLPPPPGAKPELSSERFIASARQTPEQAEWLKTRTSDVKVVPSDEKNKLLWDKLMATGYAFDRETGRMYGPTDIPLLGQKLGKRGQAPREINGVLVFNPRPFSSAMSAQDRINMATTQTRQWLGKDAIVGVDENDQTIRKRITKEDMLNFYKRQLGAPE